MSGKAILTHLLATENSISKEKAHKEEVKKYLFI